MPLKSKPNSKKYFSIVLILIILVSIYFIFFDKSTKPNEEQTMKAFDSFEFRLEGQLSFLKKNNQFISQIDIEIADDDESRATGLMYRNKLAENQGMLFTFDSENIQSFWMKNTVLSLDMIFVNKENEIVKIHKNTIPFSEQSYSSMKPATYVVEVNAGYTDKYLIAEGDKISWRKL